MINKVFIDLDGVLADFEKGVFEIHDIDFDYDDWPLGEWDMQKILGMSDEEFWIMDEHWWAELNKTPEFDEIMNLVEGEFGRENICLLSSPTEDPTCIYGKAMWIQKNLPYYAEKRQYFLGAQKYFAAAPDALLIDDSDDNVDKFEAAWGNQGGKTILVPRIWNSNHTWRDRIVEYLKWQIDVHTGKVNN